MPHQAQANTEATSPAHDAQLAQQPVASRPAPRPPDDEPGTGFVTPDAAPSTGMSRMYSRQSRHGHHSAGPSVDYDVPDAYRNLDDARAPAPVQEPGEGSVRRADAFQDDYDPEAKRRRPGSATRTHSGGATDRMSQSSLARAARTTRRQSDATPVDYDVPDQYTNLGEVTDVSPVQNPDEDPIYHHEDLEQVRSRDQEYIQEQRLRRKESRDEEKQSDRVRRGAEKEDDRAEHSVSRFATQIFTLSYLVFFSILGTLARLGLQALTSYPGTPVIFPSLWPNFAGSLVMGFIAEDRMLFRYEWGTPTYENQLKQAQQSKHAGGESSGSSPAGGDMSAVDLAAAKKAYAATKKTIPLYIGMATGFCGSFTSFSSFIRDVFLALSNDLAAPGVAQTVPRNGGYSFMALLAVLLVTVSASLSGLFIGAHLAIALEPITPSLPYLFTRKFLDRSAVILGWGCWIGAVMLCIWPPDRHDDGGVERWRGDATFALVLAPLGCLARFYASLYLNGRVASFPLGTFAVNVAGTAVLAMAWDLAHVPEGGIVGCQVLQGVEDGFCGCLTTVSTWVTELAALRRRHAYVYGGASVVVALAVMVAVMGGLRWSDGFSGLACSH